MSPGADEIKLILLPINTFKKGCCKGQDFESATGDGTLSSTPSGPADDLGHLQHPNISTGTNPAVPAATAASPAPIAARPPFLVPRSAYNPFCLRSQRVVTQVQQQPRRQRPPDLIPGRLSPATAATSAISPNRSAVKVCRV